MTNVLVNRHWLQALIVLFSANIFFYITEHIEPIYSKNGKRKIYRIEFKEH